MLLGGSLGLSLLTRLRGLRCLLASLLRLLRSLRHGRRLTVELREILNGLGERGSLRRLNFLNRLQGFLKLAGFESLQCFGHVSLTLRKFS